MEIQQAFKSLTDSKINYACIEGYQTNFNSPVYHILTTDVQAIIRLLNLKQVGKANENNSRYELEVNTPIAGNPANRIVDLYLYRKGAGLFPDRYENQILMRHVVYEDIIRIPDDDCRMWMTLFNMSKKRSGSVLSEADQKSINSMITQKFGEAIAKCKYSDVAF